jgi:hypothetical protein
MVARAKNILSVHRSRMIFSYGNIEIKKATAGTRRTYGGRGGTQHTYPEMDWGATGGSY